MGHGVQIVAVVHIAQGFLGRPPQHLTNVLVVAPHGEVRVVAKRAVGHRLLRAQRAVHVGRGGGDEGHAGQ